MEKPFQGQGAATTRNVTTMVRTVTIGLVECSLAVAGETSKQPPARNIAAVVGKHILIKDATTLALWKF